MKTAELQSRLRALGLDPGPSDGVYGELTEEAVFDALDLWAPAVDVPAGIIPLEWLSACSMDRVMDVADGVEINSFLSLGTVPLLLLSRN